MPVVHKWSRGKRVSLSAYSNNTDEISVEVIVAFNCSIFIEQCKLVNSRVGGSNERAVFSEVDCNLCRRQYLC